MLLRIIFEALLFLHGPIHRLGFVANRKKVRRR